MAKSDLKQASNILREDPSFRANGTQVSILGSNEPVCFTPFAGRLPLEGISSLYIELTELTQRS